MIFRIILMFVVLAVGSAFILYLASCTDYFNAKRLKRLARNAALLGAGSLIAALALALLMALAA